MLERISIPRRALDFEDYIDILRRNFRWVIGPVFVGLVISTVTAYFLEDTFRSAALIRIVPPQIPDTLVQNSNTQQLEDHINAMAESILSRNTLTNMINTYHLYQNELKSEPMEDVINKMKSSILIRPTEGVANVTEKRLPAMRVSFVYRDRNKAKQVCDDIVGRFMSQNAQESLEAHESTNQFLSDEAAAAKKSLDTIDQKLADFRERNAGRLPEEMTLNVQQMNTLTQRANSLSDALNRNTETHMLLESNLRIVTNQLNAIKDITPQSQARNEHVSELDKQIQTLQLQIEGMKDRYTDDFPDLQSARKQLVILKRQREEALKERALKAAESPSPENPMVTRERMDGQAQIEHLQTQLKATDLERGQLQASLGQANAQIGAFQSRMQGIPASDKEYLQLMNDRELAQKHYADMAGRREKSAISMDMERRKQGEMLEILDSASLPAAPEAPKRAMIIPMGPGIGLVLGIILIAIREMKDTSLKNLKDARLYTQLSVLGSIPLLENDLVVQRRKQMMWVGWAAATVAGLAVMAVSIAHYYLTKA
jgi:uncharacterized protein involved in exopolysaccharide biosynthesis